MQVIDPQELAGACPECGYGLGVVREYFLYCLGHCLNDGHCFGWQMAPHVVAKFLPGIFHVPHQDTVARFVQVSPLDSGDLFLAARREQREGGHLEHVD